MRQNLKLAVYIIVCSALWGFRVNAQNIVIDDQKMAKPIPLFANEENDKQADVADFYDQTISYYVQNLDLSAEQIDLAQQISAAEQKDKDEIIQRLEILRQAAYELEANSLKLFEAILNEDQKIKFRQLQEKLAQMKQKNRKTSADDDLLQAEE